MIWDIEKKRKLKDILLILFVTFIVYSLPLLYSYIMNSNSEDEGDYNNWYCGNDVIQEREIEYIRPHNLPNNTDDWTIHDGDLMITKNLENKIILLTGNLQITGADRLPFPEKIIFNNVTIIMNCSRYTEGEYGHDYYEINIGCNFIFNNSLITAYDANYKYVLNSGGGLAVEFLNSEFSYARHISVSSNATIYNCIFKNSEYGLSIGLCYPTNFREIRYCLFENNSYGICLAKGSNSHIKFNIFRNNTDYAVGDDIGLIKMEYNYWGTTNRSEISSMIKDENADFEPWLDEPPF